MMNIRSTAGALCAASLLLVGCLGPRSDPSQFFVLTSLAETEVTDSITNVTGISIGVGPVTLPSYLNRPEMVTRVGANRVEMSEYARWAVSLHEDFVRALSENLAVLLETDRVVVHPWYSSTEIDYAIRMDVIRFERVADGGAELLCRWTISDGAGADLDAREARFQQVADATDVEASVAAQSRALADLSRELATTIRRLDRERGRAAKSRQPDD